LTERKHFNLPEYVIEVESIYYIVKGGSAVCTEEVYGTQHKCTSLQV